MEKCSCEGYFRKIIAGEIIGTFLMCFFGVGAFATASLFGAHGGAFEIGMVWGITIAIAIYAARNLSSAHFNPAVTFAMCLSGRTPWKDLPIYVLAQMIGAVIAAFVLWIFFAASVQHFFEMSSTDMSVVSKASAIWCNIFPNIPNGVVSMPVAAFAEGVGVFILIAVIFAARDLGPRIVRHLVGWDKIAFSWDAIIVYTLAPLLASICAAGLLKVIEPLQKLGYK